MEKRKIRVAAAVFYQNGKILATQRGYGPYKDWWEFPGGKIELNETPEEALIREILEELNVEIYVDSFLKHVEYEYTDFHLSMDCFLCSFHKGTPVFSEHEDSIWLPIKELRSLKWLPADYLVLDELEKL